MIGAILDRARAAEGAWVEIDSVASIDFGDFAQSALCTSGLVVRTRAGDTYLIGDLNQRGGGCECCGITHSTEIAAVRWAMRPAPETTQ